MDIVLALLRTLIFVVATVAATVYIGRRIGRGRPLLWAGTTLLALHWLIGFGWTSYQAGSPNATPDVAGWVLWAGYLLPFFAALAFIWGIGQAAGFPSRAGAPAGQPGAPSPVEHAGAAGPGASGAVPPPTTPGTPRGGAPTTSPSAGPAARVVPVAGTPAEPRHKHKPRPPGLGVPHAVPVVMTPSASHHSPPDPDPVVDLGPDDDVTPPGALGAPQTAAPGVGETPGGGSPTAPAGPRPDPGKPTS